MRADTPMGEQKVTEMLIHGKGVVPRMPGKKCTACDFVGRDSYVVKKHYQSKHTPRECPQCGKTFTKYESGNDISIFCSAECRYARKRRKIEEYRQKVLHGEDVVLKRDAQGRIIKKTTEDFVAEATKMHGTTYDYSESVYYNSKSPIRIICRVHGAFPQRPDHHVRGSGCRQCKRLNDSRPDREAKFIAKSKDRYGDKFGYDEVYYTNSYTKVKLFCNVHKEYFTTSPSSHFVKTDSNSGGCKLCARQASNDAKRLSLPEVLEKIRKVHGDTYDYSLVRYHNHSMPITLICPKEGHGEFTKSLSNIEKGQGCPECSDYGFKELKDGYYYVHSITDQNGQHLGIYKGGITNNLQVRFGKLKSACKKIELKIVNVDMIPLVGIKGKKLEKKLLAIKEIRHVGIGLPDGDGELFNCNPLQYLIEKEGEVRA